MFFLGFKEYGAPREQLADYLPWALMERPGVLRLKDGSLMRALSYRGHDPARLTDEERVALHEHLNAALQRLGAGWSLWVELRRTPLRAPSVRASRHDVVGLVEEIRCENLLSSGQLFSSTYTLTLVWTPAQGKGWRLLDHMLALLGGLFEGGEAAREEQEEEVRRREELERFLRGTREFLDATSSLYAQASWLGDAEVLTYLHGAISTHEHPITPPDIPMYLDGVLADEVLEVGTEMRLGAEHVRVISLKGYPDFSHPHLLHQLEQAALPFRLVSRFMGLSQEESLGALRSYQNLLSTQTESLNPLRKKGGMRAINEAVVAEVSSVSAARLRVEQNRVTYGHHSCVVVVRDRDYRLCQERAEQVLALCRAQGFACVEESAGLKGAWLSSLPGHLWANPRRALISTRNLAHMMPTQAIWEGEARNTHLGGPAHLTCASTGSAPFHLNLNVQDVGHTLILGPTGAGKSTLLTALELGWMTYEKAQLFIFDKGRSARAATLAYGGAFLELSSSAGAVAFQPFARVDEAGEREFLSTWLEEVATLEGVNVGLEERAAIHQALDSLASTPLHLRTFTSFTLALQHHTLRAAFSPFGQGTQGAGLYASLWDNSEERLALSRWTTLEMEQLMESSPRLIAMTLRYLFHRLEQRFDGSPTLLVLDEAWIFLDHELFAPRIRQWLKTLRKLNVYVLFATQEIVDALSSRIAPTLLQNCPTQILLPNPRALSESMAPAYRTLGLSDGQIRTLALATSKRDYYLHNALGSRLFSLALSPLELTLAASSPEAQQRIDLACRRAAQQGEDFLSHYLELNGFHSYATRMRVRTSTSKARP